MLEGITYSKLMWLRHRSLWHHTSETDSPRLDRQLCKYGFGSNSRYETPNRSPQYQKHIQILVAEFVESAYVHSINPKTSIKNKAAI